MKGSHKTLETLERTSNFFLLRLTICPETVTDLIHFQFLRCKKLRYGARNEFSQRLNLPEITVRKSLRSPVRITAPKNNSKTISVM